jgi:5-methylcytosine-specific restriction endonuclease McrA
MNPHYPHIADRADHRCEYCRAPEAIFNHPFEVEHIVPTARGGTNNATNLALACRSCNLFKSDRVAGTDPETNQTVALFDPRRDTWEVHFRLARESGAIQGLTTTGRATIERLRMNAPLQLTARQAWSRLGLFS